MSFVIISASGMAKTPGREEKGGFWKKSAPHTPGRSVGTFEGTERG
jgi:hypothetical protein